MSDAGVRLRELLATGVVDHRFSVGLAIGLSGFHHRPVLFAVIMDVDYFLYHVLSCVDLRIYHDRVINIVSCRRSGKYYDFRPRRDIPPAVVTDRYR
jgi:hypothetical protein